MSKTISPAMTGYAEAGVNREAGDALVDRIKLLTRGKHSKKVKTAVGGYAALYEFGKREYLAATTDGVGTKLKLAFSLGEHTTIGQDLVAMSVNDLICVGAEPMFFLDYFATGKLDVAQAEKVLQGIVAACDEASCALVGGETAEMPGFYQDGEYDLAGFAVGRVAISDVLPRKDIKPGDVVLGLGSSGFHSNGYSILRKWIERDANPVARARELLTPTRLYVSSVVPVLKKGWIKGLAHITGSSMLNIPRISDKVGYRIQLPKDSEIPPCFAWARKQGMAFEEMVQTLNMGIGMVVVCAAQKSAPLIRHFKKHKIPVWEIGEVVKGKGEVEVADEWGFSARIR